MILNRIPELTPLEEEREFKVKTVHENVGDVITVSSSGQKAISMSEKPDAVCDKNFSTAYSSNNGIGDYVGIDFCKTVWINRVNLYFKSWNDASRMDGCAIQVLEEGEWKTDKLLPTSYDGMDKALYPPIVDLNSTYKCSGIRLIRLEENDYTKWVSNSNALVNIYELEPVKVVTEENVREDYLDIVQINEKTDIYL